MDPTSLFEEFRGRLSGQQVTDRQLAANSLSVWVATGPLESTGYTVWFDPSWHVVGPSGVLAGSRQAQDEEDASGWAAVTEAVDILIGRSVEDVRRDSLTGDLELVLSGGFRVRSFVTDPRDKQLWHIRDLSNDWIVSGSTTGLAASESKWRFPPIPDQFQDPDSQDDESPDWILKQQVERDICLLYHQLAEYSNIMGDLYYGSVFELPYWEYLDFPGLDTVDRDFLREGCLVMLLAMACDEIDGSGTYIRSHIPACREAIARIASDDEDTEKLVRTVRLALDVAEQEGPETRELTELSGWVHRRYVRGYFCRIAQEFDSNPYFRD